MVGVQVVSGRNFLGHISRHLKLVVVVVFFSVLFVPRHFSRYDKIGIPVRANLIKYK